MGIVLCFPRHATSNRSRRAAKSASNSTVTPEEFALDNLHSADHHSAGIELRCHHLETDVAGWPISAPRASRDGQSSMIERNEVKSDMPLVIGRRVLECKSAVSLDNELALGQTVLMGKRPKVLTAADHGIIWRTIKAREKADVSQPEIAAELGIPQDTYKNYETKRPITVRPELIAPFCQKTGILPGDLFRPLGALEVRAYARLRKERLIRKIRRRPKPHQRAS